MLSECHRAALCVSDHPERGPLACPHPPRTVGGLWAGRQRPGAGQALIFPFSKWCGCGPEHRSGAFYLERQVPENSDYCRLRSGLCSSSLGSGLYPETPEGHRAASHLWGPGSGLSSFEDIMGGLRLWYQAMSCETLGKSAALSGPRFPSAKWG